MSCNLNLKNIITELFFFVFCISCKKLIEIPPPVNTITTSEVFSTDEQATSALMGIYANMIMGELGYCNSAMTVFPGLSSDELNFFDQASDVFTQFQHNGLLSMNEFISGFIWSQAYSYIYRANGVIQGIASSKSLSDSVRNQLTAQAKFIRAYCYFYLVNLFGDLPLVLTIDYNKTSLLHRSTSIKIYQQIILDLKDSQNSLPESYSVSNGERIVPNKFAATALLARVYLYTGDWVNAESHSTLVLNNTSIYRLNNTLNDVFLKNSSEAIWQLKQNNRIYPFNGTIEGSLLIPFNTASYPRYYITNHLLNSFEAGDQRKSSWVDSTTIASVLYYYTKKYKLGTSQIMFNGPYTEYYMMLRLAEQYLIRAEARAKQNNLSGSISDLNIIRQRAGLSPLAGTLTQTQVLAAIEQERKIEFFTEWGHRWLDLKRTGRADAVLGPIKGTNWQPTDQLYPIPLGELIKDPNLTQNPGY